jgi:hypothetical protein
MMGGRTPETCWAVNKLQDDKLENCCIWLVIYLSYMYFVSICISWWTTEGTYSWIRLVSDLIFVFLLVKSHSVSLTLQFPQNELLNKKKTFFFSSTWVRGLLLLFLRGLCGRCLLGFPPRLHVVMVWMCIGFLESRNEHWWVITFSLIMRLVRPVKASASGELFLLFAPASR